MLGLRKRSRASIPAPAIGSVFLTVDTDGLLVFKKEDGSVVAPETLIDELSDSVAAAKGTADGALPKAGGTMTGALTLAADPTNNLHAATKQYVTAQLAALVNGAPGLLDTLKEIADQLATDESGVAALTSVVAGKQPLDEDLTKLAALSTQTFGRALLEVVDAAGGRTALGLGTAATKDVGATGEAGKLLKADDAALATDIASKLYIPSMKVPARVQRTVIQQFQSGHGYTRSSGNGTLSDDTGDYVVGSQSLKFVTLGDGATNVVQKTSITLVDFTGKSVQVKFKIEGLENVSDFSIYLSSDNASTNNIHYPIAVPAQPYVADGEWATVTINWSDLAANGAVGTIDRTKVNYLKFRLVDKNGKPVTFHVGEVSSVAEPASALCTLTFDDGWASTYSIARAYMDKYGFRGTSGIIRDLIAEVAGNYMSLAQIKALQDAGWDICAHADTVANHNAGYGTLDNATVEAELRGIKEWLIQNGLKRRDFFIWPKGSFVASQMPLVRKYFSAVRGTAGGKGGATGAHEVFPPADPYRLRCWLISNTTTAAEVEAALTQAVANKTRLHLTFHRIVPSGAAAATECNEATFKEIVDKVAASGISVKTLAEDLES
jgi:Polysaccharide deacetylase